MPRPASLPLARDGAVASAPPSVADDTHNEVAGALMAALAEGDMEAVVRLLHPDVTFTGDSNRRAPTACARHPRPGQGGAVPVRSGPSLRAGVAVDEPARAGQRPARQLHRRVPPRDDYPAMTPRVTAMTVRDGKVCADLGYRKPGQVHRLAACSSLGSPREPGEASPELKPCSVMPSAEYIRARMFSTPI